MEWKAFPAPPLPSPPDIKEVVFGSNDDQPVITKMPYRDRTWAYYRNNMAATRQYNVNKNNNNNIGSDTPPPMRVVRVNSKDKNTLRTATTKSSTRQSKSSTKKKKRRAKERKGRVQKRRRHNESSSSSNDSDSDSESTSSSSSSSSSTPSRRKKRRIGGKKKKHGNTGKSKGRQRHDDSSSSSDSSDSDSSDSYRRRVTRKTGATDPQRSQQMRKRRSKRLGLHSTDSDSDDDSVNIIEERKGRRRKVDKKRKSATASVNMTGEVTSSKGQRKGKGKKSTSVASTGSRQNSQSTDSRRRSKKKILSPEPEHESISQVLEVVSSDEEDNAQVDAQIDAEIVSMSEATDADATFRSHRSGDSEPRRGKRPEPPKKQRRGFFAWLFGKKETKKLEEHPTGRPNLSPSLSAHFGQSSLPRNNSLRASSHHRSLASSSVLEAIPESEERDESSTADHVVQHGDLELGKGSVHSPRPGIEQEFWESIRSGMKEDPSAAGSGVVGSVGFWSGEEEKKRKLKRRNCIIFGVIMLLLIAGGVAAALVFLLGKDNSGATVPAEGNGNTTMAPSLIPIATLGPSPTPAPFTSSPTQLFQCEICGTGQGFEVSQDNLFTVVQRPPQSSATCGELQDSAEAGLISRTECAAWQLYVPGVCC